MAPHGIYRSEGDDEWVAIACRDQADWRAFGGVVGGGAKSGEDGESWCAEPRFAEPEARLAAQDALDRCVQGWTAKRSKFDAEEALLEAGVPAAAVRKPEERIDGDAGNRDFGLWPTVRHAKMGEVRVDGEPVRFSRTDWRIERGAPCLGEHTEEVLGRVLGMGAEEVAALREEGVA